jgi:hypothetical protein
MQKTNVLPLQPSFHMQVSAGVTPPALQQATAAQRALDAATAQTALERLVGVLHPHGKLSPTQTTAKNSQKTSMRIQTQHWTVPSS